MTPKEKAKSLYKTYYSNLTDVLINREAHEFAIICSLLCVDELIEQISLPKDEWFEEIIEYLKEVKKELHQL